MEVVVLAQKGSDLISVGGLDAVCDQAMSANLMMASELWVTTQTCENREYRRGQRGSVVESQTGDCGGGLSALPGVCPVRRFRIRSQRAVLSPRSLS